MKTTTLLLGTILYVVSQARADTIALWTFESPNVPPTVTAASVTGLLPATGSGTASGVHASSASAFSSPVGNGSAHSFAADHWAVGDYWQFHVSTLGFKDIQLSLDQSATFNGPTNFDLEYSTDGTSFTSFLSHYTVFQNSTGIGGGGGVWNSTTAFPTYTRTVDLSSITALDDANDAFFRLRSNIGGQTTGSGRIDNFLVSAVPVPEPHRMIILEGVVVVFFLLRRRTSACSRS
jgi:hypothetical protein